MWPFKKRWIVYYWYYDSLGCQQIIAQTEFKGRKTSNYIQGQGLSKTELRKVERFVKYYTVKFGFVPQEPTTWIMRINT